MTYDILELFNKLKGQFVINGSKSVERLIAVVEDDMDYYWVTYDGRKTHLETCVRGLIQLKNKIEDKDYDEFIRLAELNHFDRGAWGKNPEQIKQEITQFLNSGDIKLVTEICWDLN